MNRSGIHLGIACPMANEGESGVRFVEAALAECSGFASVRFFAVVDKVSKDDTLRLLQALAAVEPRLSVVWAPENECVVDAYVRGYRAALDAQSDWVLEIDGGFSHDPGEIGQFFDRMEQGYDCVFGSRFIRGGSIRDSSLWRRFVSRGGTVVTNLALGTRLTDMTSGFELFRADVLRMVLSNGIRSRGPFFQTEIKFFCRHLNVAEVPITYRNATASVGTRQVTESFRNLWELYKESKAAPIESRITP
jgi:dolichol-phosphate mannosyltransferase